MPRLILSGVALTLVVALAMLSSPNFAADPPPADTARVRIGTYDARAVAVAFVASATHNAHITELTKQAKQAEAAGQTQRLAELRARGAALQTVRHLQGFGNASIDDIIAQIEDQLPQLAAKANVRAVVRRTDFQDPTIETIDLTDDLVSLFNPSERTLKIVKDLRTKKPLPLETILVGERQERRPGK